MFVGIDVAKAELVVSILPSAERFTVATTSVASGRSSSGFALLYQC